jgi:hypothetical protein
VGDDLSYGNFLARLGLGKIGTSLATCSQPKALQLKSKRTGARVFLEKAR